MIHFANRLNGIKEYYFSKKLQEIRGIERKGENVFNLGIGNPDLTPPKEVITSFQEELSDQNIHGYQNYRGIDELRSAWSYFYLNNFNVQLDPDYEILPTMGSKEAIFHISMAILNTGDEVLIPDPGYPAYKTITRLVGGKPVMYNLYESNSWLPDLDELSRRDLSRVKIIWVNYPNMPTGARAGLDFFSELVAFALKHNILICHDNPYGLILNDNPISVLNIKDAKSVAVELNSISKAFNMAGWRVGMIAGNQKLISAFMKVLSNQHSGMFLPIQKSTVLALRQNQTWFENLNRIYKIRQNISHQIAQALNCTCRKNQTGMFNWMKLPGGVQSELFVDNLLREKRIFMAPGTLFGSQGEGFVRMSLCAKEDALMQVLEMLYKPAFLI